MKNSTSKNQTKLSAHSARIVFSLLFTLAVLGCATSSSQKEVNVAIDRELPEIAAERNESTENPVKPGAAKCDYNNLSGSEYRLTESFAPNVTESFMFDANLQKLNQMDSGSYSSLRNFPFKVAETGVQTTDAIENQESYLDEYRYVEVMLVGQPFKIDTGNSTKVITSDCTTYYYVPGDSPEQLKVKIIQSSGAPLTDEQFILITGVSTLEMIDTPEQ